MLPKKLMVGEIPVVVTGNHNWNFYHWLRAKIRKATVFRIDAHADLADGAPEMPEKTPGSALRSMHYASRLTIANFNCPAFHHGIFSSGYWANPHIRDEQQRIKDLGSTSPEEGRRHIETKVLDRKVLWRISDPGIVAVRERDVRIQGPLVVDIDLDGIVLADTVMMDAPYAWESRYREARDRLDYALSVLENLKETPALISITRSQGYVRMRTDLELYRTQCFVHPHIADHAEKMTLQGLRSLYAHR